MRGTYFRWRPTTIFDHACPKPFPDQTQYPASPPAAYGSGPRWRARPFSYDSLIRDSRPVQPGAFGFLRHGSGVQRQFSLATKSGGRILFSRKEPACHVDELASIPKHHWTPEPCLRMRSIPQTQGRNAHLLTSTHFSDEPEFSSESTHPRQLEKGRRLPRLPKKSCVPFIDLVISWRV